MALRVDQALARQHPCFGDCHRTLTAAQRARAVECIYFCDDALRGWGYEPIYDIDGARLWREAQRKNDPSYRGVAVRFGECIYRRLVGSLLHEVLHACFGDPSLPNYGIPFGLPYAVPLDVADHNAAEYLAPFNFCEARAFAGVWVLAERRFGIDWRVLNARDYPTLCFPGGNALVPPVPGYRPIAHIDPVHHEERYRTRAAELEQRALAWFTDDAVADVVRRCEEAAARGRATRPTRYLAPEAVARIAPVARTRNDPCPCGSGKKVKKCCDERAAAAMV